eukprot:gene10485-3007_t
MWRLSFPRSTEEEEVKIPNYMCPPDTFTFRLLSHMKSTEIDLESKNKPYVIYLIRIEISNRSWCVKKRYNNFFDLRKNLRGLGYENLPPLPPKVAISQLWQNVPNKRIGGLQSFIDQLTQINGIVDDSNIIDFFNLNKVEENILYQVPDEIFHKIFKYIPFQDLFGNVSAVSFWFRKLVFSTYSHIEFIFINKTIYFGSNIVSIKSIHDLGQLVEKFIAAKYIKFDSLYYLDDSIWDNISKKCKQQQKVIITKCGLEKPNFSSPTISLLNLQYCTNLTSISLSRKTYQCLRNLNLSGTKINDITLNEILKKSINLIQLECYDCENLIKPNLSSKKLTKINLSFCENLTNPTFETPKCKVMNLRNTAIVDDVFLNSFFNQSIEKLYLSGCVSLKSPTIKCQKLQELYLGCCTSMKENFIFDCPNLKVLDIQLTQIKFDNFKEKFPELIDVRK